MRIMHVFRHTSLRAVQVQAVPSSLSRPLESTHSTLYRTTPFDDHRAIMHGRTFGSYQQKSAAIRAEAQRRNSSAPRYAGELPVLFAVEDIDLWHGALYSQYYPDPRAAILQGPDGLSAEMRRAIFGEVLTLCASSIHLGLALRCAEGQPSVAALPGRFVRTELKRWKWEPLFTDWDQYLAGPRGVEEVDY
ncbi:hypothetical protein VTO73DRAFT_4114 [Trametes versicolor]